MELEFDPHAWYRMRRRQIPEAAVYHVIADYDDRLECEDGGPSTPVPGRGGPSGW